MKYNLFIILILIGFSCSRQPVQNFEEQLAQSERTVLMFFAPDCPLCITFSKPINRLIDSFPEVQFMAVLSGEHYSKAEVQEYFNETGLKAELVYDADYSIARKFKAGTTPEFVLTDKETNVLYQGLLDDRMKNIGVYKKVWSEHYLQNALEKAQKGLEIEPKHTTAIGCVLEY